MGKKYELLLARIEELLSLVDDNVFVNNMR
jgi:hypothetical protein